MEIITALIGPATTTHPMAGTEATIVTRTKTEVVITTPDPIRGRFTAILTKDTNGTRTPPVIVPTSLMETETEPVAAAGAVTQVAPTATDIVKA